MNKLREAMEQYADLENWGYYDGSGCPKGHGRYTDACFIGPDVAAEALQAYDEQWPIDDEVKSYNMALKHYIEESTPYHKPSLGDFAKGWEACTEWLKKRMRGENVEN